MASLTCSVYWLKAQPETLQIVQSTIAKQLSIDEATVTPQTKFSELGADSLDTVRPQILALFLVVSYVTQDK